MYVHVNNYNDLTSSRLSFADQIFDNSYIRLHTAVGKY